MAFWYSCAATRSAAVVDLQHRVAVGCQKLADVVEGVIVLAVGAAMNPEDQRQLAGGRAGRPGEQAVDHRAVLRRERDVLDGRHRDLVHPRVVVRRQLPQRSLLHHVDLVRRRGRRREQRDGAVRAGSRRADDAAAGGERLDLAAVGRHARQVLDPIVLDDDVEALAVGRPLRRAHRPVQRLGEQRRGAAGSRDHGELGLVVGVPLRFVALQVRDPLAVWTPRQRAAVLPGVSRQLPRRRAGLRVDHEDVAVVAAIGHPGRAC